LHVASIAVTILVATIQLGCWRLIESGCWRLHSHFDVTGFSGVENLNIPADFFRKSAL
jgi:hypothetical protein